VALVASTAFALNTVAAPVAPTTTVSIATVTDNVGVKQGNLVFAESTDDTTLALTGTLSAALGAGEVLAVYDGSTKLNNATVVGTNWNYTTAALAAGGHSLTARVENTASGLGGTVSTAFAANVQSLSVPTITVDTGGVIGTGTVRYILLKQTGVSSNLLFVNEVEVYSGGFNVALGKAVTAGAYSTYSGYPASGVTNSNLARDGGNGYASNVNTTDNWLQIDLGQTYSIDSINVYALSSAASDLVCIKNVDFFASENNISGLSYAQLVAGGATRLGGTGGAPAYTTTVDNLGTLISSGVIDATPTLSGTLSAALALDERLAVYDGSTKLGNATVIGTTWIYTPGTALGTGVHNLKVVVEDSAGSQALVVGNKWVTIVSAVAPTTTVAITSVSDDVATGGSYTGVLTNGTSTDDTTLALTGTLSAALGAGEVLAVYDGSAFLGNATVVGNTWNYTTAALAAGTHSLTARVENQGSNLIGTPSIAFVTQVQSLTLQAQDDAGALTGLVGNGQMTNDTTPTLSGSLGTVLLTGEELALYSSKDGAAAVKLTTLIPDGLKWSYTPALDIGSSYKFSVAVQSVGANQLTGAKTVAELTVNEQGTAAGISELASASGFDLASFAFSLGAGQLLDLTAVSGAAQPRIDKVNLAALSSIKLTLADVLSAGSDLFTAGNGYTGLVTTSGAKQMLITGVQGSQVNVADAGGWATAGSVDINGHTYLVYNHDIQAQLLVDSLVTRVGAVI
jgi:hypothetical protein